MAQLTQRRSTFENIEPLSVVYLAITYAVLTIALATEWGRIVRVFATDIGSHEPDVVAPFQSSPVGDLF